MKELRIILPSIIILIGALIYAQTNKNTMNTVDLTESIKKIETTNLKEDKEHKLSAPNTFVKIATTYGDIIVELYDSKSPVTVDNFLTYVEDGEYDSTIFHRVIKNFMIQGGGFTKDLKEKPSKYDPILNEAAISKLKNKKGSIAMARTNDPNSATSQFYINSNNNINLDWDKAKDNYGYAVFGQVIEGLNIVDSISFTKTRRKGRMGDVPVETIFIKSIKIIDRQKEK